MDILSDSQRDGLLYIEAANSGGYRPTAAQVDEWVFRRAQRPAKRGPLLEPAKPATALPAGLLPALSGFGEVGRAFDIMSRYLDTSAVDLPTRYHEMLVARGAIDWASIATGTPAKYGPGEPAETLVEHMIRLSWVTATESGDLRLSPLGRALLRNDGLTNDSGDAATVIVLEAGDELAYPQLIGHIAECGDALIIDPYAKADFVWRLMATTSTTRVLTGPDLRAGELAELRDLLTVAPRPIEVRQAGRGILHDRFIIGPEGVHQVGASGTTIGKKVTTLFQHPHITAERIVELAEQWWDAAEVIRPTGPPPSAVAPDPEDGGPAPDSPKNEEASKDGPAKGRRRSRKKSPPKGEPGDPSRGG